jgi:prepilin-type N-terminal cleavage/methylation domain-containing protein
MSALVRSWMVRLRVEDRGLTLVELLVAMGIFVIVLAVFMTGVVSMTRTTASAQGVSDATTSTRKVLDRFDRQVRYSTGINRPGLGSSGSYYVEFAMPAQAAGAIPLCVQWRYDPAARTIALRTWNDTATPSPTGWSSMASNVRNDLATEAPFKFFASNSTSKEQALQVLLDIGVGSQRGALVATTYVARNTSTATQTNPDLDLNNLSDTPVCQAGVGRP